VSNRSKAAYSITSSALASSDGGTVRPNMRAVVLLMTSSNLVDCTTGKSPGFALLGGAVSLFLCVSAAAQEGYYGVGHDKWHQGFYSRLKRNDGQSSCCNLLDYRPTQSRLVGDHYEVKMDGVWTPVPDDKINNWSRPMVALTSALRDR
jgi:hypothetical protein